MRMATRSSTTWGPGKDGILSGNGNIGSCIIPFLLWKGYQDGNIWINENFIASIICHVENILYKKFWKNSSIVANYRIFWDDLYMHRVMLNVNESHSGRNTLMISYGSWGNVKLSHRYGIERYWYEGMKVVCKGELLGLSKKEYVK